jgi:cytochrome c-type biogenesis protein CcmH
MMMRVSRIDAGRFIKVGRWAALLVAALVCLMLAPAAGAQEGPTQDDVNAVARQLFCPVCENTPLDVCPLQACQNWREEIRVALVEGKTEQEILNSFAVKYGDSVLAQPPTSRWVAWLLPIGFVVVAFGALGYWLRSWMRPAAAVVEAAPVDESAGVDPDDPYLAQVAKELSEWDA